MLDKIREAKTGISLHRISKPVLIISSAATSVFSILIAFVVPIEELGKEVLKFAFGTLVNEYAIRIVFDLLFSKVYKIISKEQLRELSYQLKNIKVNTNTDLILDSYKYKTEYKWVKNENDTDLIQKKYIMVPVIEDGEEK